MTVKMLEVSKFDQCGSEFIQVELTAELAMDLQLIAAEMEQMAWEKCLEQLESVSVQLLVVRPLGSYSILVSHCSSPNRESS